MLLEEIGYVVETVSIFGRTTAVVHALVNCYAPTIIRLMTRPHFFGLLACTIVRILVFLQYEPYMTS